MDLDPTTEIKQIRHRLGAKAGYDLARIFAELKTQRANNV